MVRRLSHPKCVFLLPTPIASLWHLQHQELRQVAGKYGLLALTSENASTGPTPSLASRWLVTVWEVFFRSKMALRNTRSSHNDQVEAPRNTMQQAMNSIETEATLSKEDELMEEMKVEDNDAPHQKKKRIRYLHDTDRHNIIKRIDKGEKQAALAREYGVTRAAICHINKNREEIIARYDLLIKQTQEINRAENVTNSFEEYAMVREVQSSSVLLLMTKLRDRRSGPETFRSVAGRLIMLLLEEAIAATNTHAVEMTTTTGHTTHGLQRTDEFCGVAIGSEGFPFLVLFRQMEPDAAHGSIHVEQEGGGLWRLEHLDLPRDISQYRFLLFSSTVNTGGAECKAIEALCDLGVQEDHVTLVFILCSTDSLKAICNRFPRVRIITGAIDNEIDPQTQEIIPGLGDFVTRYNGE